MREHEYYDLVNSAGSAGRSAAEALEPRIAALEKKVQSLYEMIERRDKKIAKLTRRIERTEND